MKRKSASLEKNSVADFAHHIPHPSPLDSQPVRGAWSEDICMIISIFLYLAGGFAPAGCAIGPFRPL